MENAPDWIVFFAVKEEVRPVLQRLRRNNVPVSVVNDPALLPGESAWRVGRSLLRVTGMGPRRARQLSLSLSNWDEQRDAVRGGAGKPCVLTCGFAGGLVPEAVHGRVYFDADPEFPWRKDPQSLGMVSGKFACVERVAVTRSEKLELARQTGADAVEMESGILRERCCELGWASATVRVISDEVGVDLPMDFNRTSTPDGGMRWGVFAWELVKSPGSIPKLIRFQTKIQSAAERLADALVALEWARGGELG